MEINHLHDIVNVYGCIVSSYVSGNDEYSSQIRNSLFHSYVLPSLSVREFMERIYKYFNCSGECYLLSLIYIDRLIRLDSFVINGYCIHRVILTSLMLAAKFFDDVYFTNAFYSEVGGVSVEEINTYEVDFLCRIRFSIWVSPQEFQKYYADIVDHCSSICQRCYGIHLPTIMNCTPFDETPLLRYKKRRHGMLMESVNSITSDFYSLGGDYFSTSGMTTPADSCSLIHSISNASSNTFISTTGNSMYNSQSAFASGAFSSQGLSYGYDSQSEYNMTSLPTYALQASYVNQLSQGGYCPCAMQSTGGNQARYQNKNGEKNYQNGDYLQMSGINCQIKQQPSTNDMFSDSRNSQFSFDALFCEK